MVLNAKNEGKVTVNNIRRRFKNIYYIFKGIKEISDSDKVITFECRKCGSNLLGYKGYGKLRIVCKCGHAANIYTGRDVQPKRVSNTTLPKDEARLKLDRYIFEKTDRLAVFRKHIKSDLRYLFEVISKKRDIAKQANYSECIDLLKGVDNKDGYERIVRNLQNFCGLDLISLNIAWQPLENVDTLINLSNQTSILGTTYYLPMGSLLFYTVYLNPTYLRGARLLPTIAHELSHVYAAHNKIAFQSPDNDRGDKEYNEQMTDLVGIAVGMGELMCAVLDKSDTPNAGYLTNEMIHEAYNLWSIEYLSGHKRQ